MQPAIQTRPGWIPYLALAGSLLLSGIATYSAGQLFQTRDKLQFANGIQQTMEAIHRRLDIYAEMLVLGSALHAATPDLTREAFGQYVQRLRVRERYPGIQGIGFTVRVPAEHKDEWIRRMRQQGFPDFRIWPESGGAEDHAIIFLEPLDFRNQRAIGYNMFAEPVRRAAMERACDTGVPAASGRVVLVQETGQDQQPGFLIYVPVYRGGRVPATVEERRQNLLGFVYSPFRGRDLFQAIVGDETQWPVDFQVFDGPTANAENLLYETPDSKEPQRQPRFVKTELLVVADRTWVLQLTSGANLEATSGAVVVPFLGFGGLAVSLLLFRLTSAQARAYASVEESAARLRASQAELAASEELHRLVTEAAADAIITLDAQGLIQAVNPAAEWIFGHSPEELVGSPFNRLIPQALLARPGSSIDLAGQSAERPKAWKGAELMALHKSGHQVPVEISFSSYVRNGSQFFTRIIRDVSHRKKAEAIQKRRAEQMALRADVSSALAQAGGSVPEVLQDCAEALARHLPTAAAQVWTSRAGGELELRSSAGISTPETGGRCALGRFVIHRVLKEARAHWTQNLESSPELEQLGWLKEAKIASVACFPLKVEGQVVGVLAVFARESLTADTLEALAVVSDIIAQGIERKRIEQALHQSEERLRLAIESAELGTWELNPVTNQMRCSERMDALTGLGGEGRPVSRDEFLVRVYPADREALQQALTDALDPSGPGHVEVDFRSLWADGTVRWISAKGRAFFESTAEGRRAVRLAGTVLDVTRRKQVEEASRFLAEAGGVLGQSLNYRTALASLARLAVPRVADWCTVDLVDPEGTINRLEVVHSDPAKVELANELRRRYPLDPDLGYGIAEVVRTGQSEIHPLIPDSLLTQAARDEDQLRLLRCLGIKSAMVVPIKARQRVFGALSFVFGESGRTYAQSDLALAEGLALRAGLAVDNALLYQAAQQEILERKRAEEEVQRLNEDLEQRVHRRTAALLESNDQLEAFTYTVAHDLRAPLRAMQGFSQALLEDHSPELGVHGRDYTNRIIGAAQRMDSLIHDLLAYSRLSRSQLSPESVNLENVLDRVLLNFAAETEHRHAEIQVKRPLPKVQAHASTLEHVLINLVSNALKFVEPGAKPRVRIWAERRGDQVRLCVRDNGIGIAPDYHERIFRIFERLHGGESFPGTGIGLAIVRKGVERMGGCAGVESEPGQGSSFWIELPVC